MAYAREHSIGKLYVELDLDADQYTRKQQKLLKDAKQTSLVAEENWQKLGATSDKVLNLMEAKARNAFNQIANAKKTSTEEMFRAEQAFNAKMDAINKQRFARETTAFDTLGIKSRAHYAEQRKQAVDAYERIRSSANTTYKDIVTAKKAKNTRLRELNREMVSQHQQSMAAMTRAVLRLYAAYFVISNAMRGLARPFEMGFEAVEKFRMSVASMAAMHMTFTERSGTVVEHWQHSLRYAEAIVPVIERIAAITVMSGEEASALADAFARQGVFLDANNKAQVEAFRRVADSLPLLTKGQDIMRQINTEIRSVMTGQGAISSMLLQTLRAIYPDIDKQLETWRENNEVLERMGELFEGFGYSSGLIQKTWTTVKSTLMTTVNQILRGAMKDSFDTLLDQTLKLNKYLEENKDKIMPELEFLFEKMANSSENIEKALEQTLEASKKLIQVYRDIEPILNIFMWISRVQYMFAKETLDVLVMIERKIADDLAIAFKGTTKEIAKDINSILDEALGGLDWGPLEGKLPSPGEPKPPPDIDEKALKEAKKRLEKRLALEKEFQDKWTLIQKKGLDKRLEQLKQAYEKDRREAEKYGADMTLRTKRYLHEQNELIWKDFEEGIKKFTKEVDEYQKELIEKSLKIYGELTSSPMSEEAAEKIIEEAKKAEKEYEHMLDNIHDASVDFVEDFLRGFDDGWKGLMDSMKDLFIRTIAEMMAQKLVVPIIMPIAQSIMAQLGFGAMGRAGGGAGLGALGLAGLTEKGSAFMNAPRSIFGYNTTLARMGTYGLIGGLGYSAFGNLLGLPTGGYSGAGAGIGAGIGSIFGPWGAAIGALGGGYLGSLFGGENKYTDFLLKSRQPLGLYEDYERLYWGGSWLNERVDYAIRDIMVPTVNQMITDVANIIAILPEEMQKHFEDIKFALPGAKISRADVERDVQEWIQRTQEVITQQLYETALTAGFESEIAFDAFVAKVQQYSVMSSEIVAKGFRDALQTDDFATFERSVQDSIYNSVLDGLIAAMTQSEALKDIFKPLFLGIDRAMTQAFAGGTFDVSVFTELATPYLSAVTSTIRQVTPAFDAVMQAVRSARELIYEGNYELADSATEASGDIERLIDTLKSLSQTIDDWLADLQFSQLAPVMSAEAWRTQYGKLMAAATMPTAEEGQIRDFLDYAKDYLQFMRTFGTEGYYADIYSSVVKDVTDMRALIQSDINKLSVLTAEQTAVVPIVSDQGVANIAGGEVAGKQTFGIDWERFAVEVGKVIEGVFPEEIQITLQVDGNDIGTTISKQILVNDDLQRSIIRIVGMN